MGALTNRPAMFLRLEPLVPAALGLVGIAALVSLMDAPVEALILCAVLVGLSLTSRILPGAMGVTVRAWAVLGLAAAVMAMTGGLTSPARFLPVLAVSAYPLWLVGRSAFAYPVVASAGYLMFLFTHPGGGFGEFAMWGTLVMLIGNMSAVVGRSSAGLATERASQAAAAQLAQARFTAAFETAQSGMAIVDRLGEVIVGNQALADFLGVDRSGLHGLRLVDAAHPDDRHVLVEGLDDVGTVTEDTFAARIRFGGDTGRVAWGVVGASKIHTSNDPSEPLFVQVHDVTKEVQVAEELRESETHYRHLFGGSPVATLEVDMTGLDSWLARLHRRGVGDLRAYLSDRPSLVREGAAKMVVKDVNAAAIRMLEVDSEEDLAGPLLRPELIDESLEAIVELMCATAEGRASATATVRARTHRGSLVDGIMQSVMPVSDREGRRDRVIITMVDLTAYRRTEANLRQVQERLRTVVGAAPIVLLALDRFGVFTLAEGQGLARLGIAPGEPVGRSVFEMFRDAPQLVKAVRRATAGESFTTTVEIGSLYFDVRFSPIWESNTVSGVIGVANDVTERKQATDRLESLVRTKDEFVAGVSHELRTPLTAVVGFATELRDNLDSLAVPELHTYVDLIASQALDVADLVEDLLVAARVDMDKVAVFPEPLSVWEQIDGALATWPDGSISNVARIGPQEKALADPIRVRQILRNLLTNAQRYGGSNIEIRVAHVGRMVHIAICDDGAGIPDTERDQIFEPYQRAHASGGQPMSVGLGLTVSRQLARLMDGDLTYTHDGSWSSFTLSLPDVG